MSEYMENGQANDKTKQEQQHQVNRQFLLFIHESINLSERKLLVLWKFTTSLLSTDLSSVVLEFCETCLRLEVWSSYMYFVINYTRRLLSERFVMLVFRECVKWKIFRFSMKSPEIYVLKWNLWCDRSFGKQKKNCWNKACGRWWIISSFLNIM